MSPAGSAPVPAAGKDNRTTFRNAIQLHSLPTDSGASHNGGMVYDAEQQKWLETDGAGGHEEVDWGSDDELNESHLGVCDQNDSKDVSIAATQSHERGSTWDDFDITPEMEAKFLMSEVYHNSLFNNFLGPSEYAHYITKFTKPNAATAAPVGVSSPTNSHAVGAANSNGGVGLKTSRQKKEKEDKDKNKDTRECVEKKKVVDFDIAIHKIASATKIGNRKQRMLTEIWNVSEQ
jgi:hypothetical protein